MLTQEKARSEASERLRGLIEKIVLTPKESESGLKIDLYGDLAGILNISKGDSMSAVNILEKFCLPANDNIGKTLQASVGSGGWLPTLSSLITTAHDIGSIAAPTPVDPALKPLLLGWADSPSLSEEGDANG